MNRPIPPVTEALKPLPINNTDNIPPAPAAGKKPEPKPETCLADKFERTVQELHDAGAWGQFVNIFLVPFGALGAYPNSSKNCPKSPNTQNP